MLPLGPERLPRRGVVPTVPYIWPFPLSGTVTSGKALVWGSILSYSQWGCFVEVGLELGEHVWKRMKILLLQNIG